MRQLIVASLAALAFIIPAPAAPQTRSAQPNVAHERAVIQYRVGWENMSAEKFAEAARNFQEAIALDPEYAEAYYGLGRANMAMKKFDEAVAAYRKSRDIYLSYAGRKFSNAQDAQRARRDQVMELDDQIRYLQSLPQTVTVADQLRQVQEYRNRRLEDISRGNNATIENSVPAWVSLALGSAYFRSGQMLDAEREYKAAVATDPRTGEAYQNLAVVYLTLQRYADAERSLAAAKKTGFKVNPALEQEIKDKKKGM